MSERTAPLADSLTTALRLRRSTTRSPDQLPTLPPAALRTLHPTHPGLPPVADRPAWAPCSPCGPDCLPRAGRRADPRATLRVARRLTTLVALLLVALPVLLVGPNPRLFRAVLRAAGVRLRIRGTTYGEGGVLVVANHLSWIDVVVLGAVGPVRMIAKREVADWPLIGPMARRTGALFVDRGGLRGLPDIVAGTATALRGGAVVGVFPEGTTWCGSASGPFRRAPFQAALDAGCPVRPVRIDLALPDGRPTTAGAFVGDETLWDSLRRVLRLERLDCTLTLLPLLPPEGDRRTLAARAERAVTAAR
ncbi:lysophospholipid acyltransferase family protein [Pseudonocardia sp. NPDC049154]|uniref:lysophospholipid acyltransferase family protein n=1 Tax=Pseudonocardia sp. NPDC049154 TaxID=3155501 RepID=UPI0033E8A279